MLKLIHPQSVQEEKRFPDRHLVGSDGGEAEVAAAVVAASADARVGRELHGGWLPVSYNQVNSSMY